MGLKKYLRERNKKHTKHTKYTNYKIWLKGRFFPIRIKGRYRRDLQTDNWHYYEDYKGIVWHFRKENIDGVKGDTVKHILKDREEQIRKDRENAKV